MLKAGQLLLKSLRVCCGYFRCVPVLTQAELHPLFFYPALQHNDLALDAGVLDQASDFSGCRIPLIFGKRLKAISL